ncbi:MAG: hypothetical protein JWR40_2867, partial [Massilia sp.]|nr:hypothetical protein [Massilia sp.]
MLSGAAMHCQFYFEISAQNSSSIFSPSGHSP